MAPKISIIVPVYKVEEYLHKCIDSILSQTLNDFELILVDDGSPDNCGTICEEYKKQDNRVRVIHKENGGLSSARNVGLDAAVGEYIGFVDSDDWINSDMYESLYNMCKNNSCDIAICTSNIHYKDKIVTRDTYPLTILNKGQAMREMLQGNFYDEVVWTKLFKKTLLEDLRFPEGIVYEDTAFTYKVIHKSERVCSIGKPMYNYVKRENSTMDQAIKNIRIDAVLIYDEMYGFMKENYIELSGLVAFKLANSAMVVLNLISYSRDITKHKHDYNRVAKILNKYFYQNITSPFFPKNVKVLLAFTKLYPASYRLLINTVVRRRGV